MTVKGADPVGRQVRLLLGGLVAFFVPLIIYTIYLDQRLDAFEDTLKHNPPEALEAGGQPRYDLYHLAANPVEGQVVYVPAYSHVYHQAGVPHLLTITLSVRNTSLDTEIIVKSVRYFDTRGNEVRSYLNKPVRLPALGTTEVVVERDDASGGSGANFLVEWYANSPVTEPIIEAVMIDTKSRQGISFARRGSVISYALPDAATDEGSAAQPANPPTEKPQ
ncbi:MAG TPA: DUF3124 domain-containing protein [Acidobacteriota bacterium]|nr:DUF3124 domain-containing protein [Acidobacteriota bacterium]